MHLFVVLSAKLLFECPPFWVVITVDCCCCVDIGDVVIRSLTDNLYYSNLIRYCIPAYSVITVLSQQL